MPDLSLHRLVVQGPRHEIVRFRRAATANRTATSEGSPFSYGRLARTLPAGTPLDADLLDGYLHDLVVEPTQTLEDGMAELTYKFQLNRGDLETFLVQLSRVYTTLCFILGTVEPSVGRQVSCFVHRGHMQTWNLPESEQDKIFANVPEESDDATQEERDEIFWALVEADWAMLDAVVVHWADTAAKALATIAADANTDAEPG